MLSAHLAHQLSGDLVRWAYRMYSFSALCSTLLLQRRKVLEFVRSPKSRLAVFPYASRGGVYASLNASVPGRCGGGVACRLAEVMLAPQWLCGTCFYTSGSFASRASDFFLPRRHAERARSAGCPSFAPHKLPRCAEHSINILFGDACGGPCRETAVGHRIFQLQGVRVTASEMMNHNIFI